MNPKKLAELLELQRKLKTEIAKFKSDLLTARKKDEHMRIRILGRACLACFKDGVLIKHSKSIERILSGKMTPSDLKWYTSNPHGLFPTETQPEPQNVAGEAQQAKTQGTPSTRGDTTQGQPSCNP